MINLETLWGKIIKLPPNFVIVKADCEFCNSINNECVELRVMKFFKVHLCETCISKIFNKFKSDKVNKRKSKYN